MADELSCAISFANGYFALADGLVPDLVDHLAEDVVLDWFGQTIEGRVGVAAFMKDKKISSRHMFSEINPVTTIGYRKQRSLRRKYYSIGGTHDNGNLISIRNENVDDDNYHIKYKRQCFSDGFIIGDVCSTNNDTSEDNHDMEVEYNDEVKNKNIYQSSISKAMECNLNFDKLKLDSDQNVTPKTSNIERLNYLDCEEITCGLSDSGNDMTLKLQMRPTDTHEMEKKINQLRDKITELPLGCIQTELGQGDGPPIYNEMNSMKYIEACGVIEFLRFSNIKQIRKDIRKRLCRLQIAYSVKNKNFDSIVNDLYRQSTPITSMKTDENKVEVISKKPNELKSMKELRQLSENLVPHSNNKIHFSSDDDENDDHLDERNEFLQNLELKPMNNDDESMNDLVTPKYVRHQLTFDKSPKRLLAGPDDTRGFMFNYNIHLIIYESNTKCRSNLSHEFENKDMSDN